MERSPSSYVSANDAAARAMAVAQLMGCSSGRSGDELAMHAELTIRFLPCDGVGSFNGMQAINNPFSALNRCLTNDAAFCRPARGGSKPLN